MIKFNVSHRGQDVEVTIPDHVSLTQDQLLNYIPFKEWLKTTGKTLDLQETDKDHRFHKEKKRFRLRSILIESVNWWGPRIGFIKMDTTITNGESDRALPGTIFMRGGSVAVLIIIIPDDDIASDDEDDEEKDQRLVVMTQQPRVPAGSLSFYEIPAGMIDDAGTFGGAAIKEVKEETGLDLPVTEMVDLTGRALKSAKSSEMHLQRAMYPSPGGSDEYIALFAWEKRMSRMDINDLQDKLTGVDNEQITVKLVKYNEVWREGARDAKTLGAWALYEGLQRFDTLYDDE